MQKVTNQAITEDRVLTTNDLVFKKVFASQQNSHILIGFINDILSLGVTEVSIEDTYNIKTFYDENEKSHMRYTQVDVLARLSDGRQVTIEMQVCTQQLFKERALYYLTEIYGSNYGKHELEDNEGKYTVGERRYSALRPVYGVCIVVDNVFKKDNNPIHRFRVYDEENDIYLENVLGEELLTLVFLELKKSSGKLKKNIREWFDYFKRGEVSKDAPGYLQDACQVAKHQNLDKEEWDMISARQRAEDAALAREDYVWDSGKAEGVAEGVAEGKAQIVKNMLEKGWDIREIAEATGISKEKIEELAKE